MNVSGSRIKLCRMFLNIYKLFEINRQKSNNHIFAKLFLIKQELIWNEILRRRESLLLLILLISMRIGLVDIKNIDLKCIHDLINEMSDVDRDNGNNRDNRADKDNRDNRDDEDNKDNGKSSSHVLENTEFRLYSKINSIKDIVCVNYNDNYMSNTISRVNKNINNIFIAVIDTNVKESSLCESMKNDRSTKVLIILEVAWDHNREKYLPDMQQCFLQ
ncbi:hypothetical protein CISG_10158 [Coccidioides immitis RMSCC 3703]|uniref:Uncharacterized protein n=1 Tax=Coccidioides immitis RMSCC 3703 TaxID=454286 RepID=A0A0J8QN69_COCIT|nr:hypothetical protein CISG_10158 [Coccidioides immitis RMSCC 3703]